MSLDNSQASTNPSASPTSNMSTECLENQLSLSAGLSKSNSTWSDLFKADPTIAKNQSLASKEAKAPRKANKVQAQKSTSKSLNAQPGFQQRRFH
jgi:hypothetical protein